MISTAKKSRWCGREDSNFHGLPHSDLNAARLPIPPRPHVTKGAGRNRPAACSKSLPAKQGVDRPRVDGRRHEPARGRPRAVALDGTARCRIHMMTFRPETTMLDTQPDRHVVPCPPPARRRSNGGSSPGSIDYERGRRLHGARAAAIRDGSARRTGVAGRAPAALHRRHQRAGRGPDRARPLPGLQDRARRRIHLSRARASAWPMSCST